MSDAAAAAPSWRGPLIILLAVFVILPAILALADQGYLFRVVELTMIFGILAASLNLVTGSAGLVSLGHAAFYAIGAYTTALLAVRYGTGVATNLAASAVVAAIIAFLVAIPAIRLVRIFFTVATLSVGEIINIVITNWDGLTRGPMGVRGIPPFQLLHYDLGGRWGSYYVIAAVSLLAVWIAHRLTHSYYGNALRALREDDQSAGAMGIDVRLLKIGVFSISGGMAGMAGCLLAHSTGFISPDMFGLDESLLILTMVVVGGLGSLPGALIGACVLILVPEIAREAGHFRMVFVGLVLYLSILLKPKGVMPEARVLRLVRGLHRNRESRLA